MTWTISIRSHDADDVSDVLSETLNNFVRFIVLDQVQELCRSRHPLCGTSLDSSVLRAQNKATKFVFLRYLGRANQTIDLAIKMVVKSNNDATIGFVFSIYVIIITGIYFAGMGKPPSALIQHTNVKLTSFSMQFICCHNHSLLSCWFFMSLIVSVTHYSLPVLGHLLCSEPTNPSYPYCHTGRWTHHFTLDKTGVFSVQ